MKAEVKVAAIIQARMSSSRLPGKIMMDLVGKPVIWHVIHRLKKSTTINQIILATTTDNCDDILADYADSQGIDVVRGSRDNVLSRFVKAVEQFDPDYLVRITSDCPMIDPNAIDQLTNALIAEQGDHCGWMPKVTTLHGGFEPVSRRLFERIANEGADHPVAQEHVMGYLKINPNLGKFIGIPAPEHHIFDSARLWLDTPADLEFLRTLYDRTKAAPGEINMDDVATLLRQDPSLQSINSHVRQKAADESSRKIIMRCDGDATFGLGHISRMLAVASELRERFSISVSFAIMHSAEGVAMIEQDSFPYQIAPRGIDEAVWLGTLIDQQRPNAVVFDIRTNLSGDALDVWRDQGILCVLIDDIGPRLDHADLIFCPPTPKTLPLHNRPGKPNIKAGWDWLILRSDFARRDKQRHQDQLRILISCGASDPSNFTLSALQAINEIPRPLIIDVVAGPLFSGGLQLNEIANQSPHTVQIHNAPRNLADLMSQATIGIVSFGVTATEMAAQGLPALYLCLSPDHAQSASIFEKAHLGTNLGVFTPRDALQLQHAVCNLLDNPVRRNEMSKIAMQTIDGQGARRIAKSIAERINAKD